MRLGDMASTINRIQSGTRFKIAASAVVVILAVLAIIWYSVQNNAPAVDDGSPEAPAAVAPASPANSSTPANETDDARLAREAEHRADAEIAAVWEGISSQRTSSVGFAALVLVLTGVALVVIWIGLGLTYLALVVVGGGMALLLRVIPATKGAAPIVAGIVFLTAMFTALMQAARLLLSGTGPVRAIARNVLAESVRLKLSLVAVFLLIVGLALLPWLLEADQPLRYRVQAFIQYAIGSSFWLIALLVLVFCVASVAFEQRDKTIWQTMTKPVAAWKYVLGKWLGVMTLAAVLLAVSGSAVFLFTEYLRAQPAWGERADAPYVPLNGNRATADRLVLENQILTARRSIEPVVPEIDPAQLEANIQRRVQEEIQARTAALAVDSISDADRQAMYDAFKDEAQKSVSSAFRYIPPTGVQTYRFVGLADAKVRHKLITLRYKINSGANSPDALYNITFVLKGPTLVTKQAALAQTQVLQMYPTAIDDDGSLTIQIVNGNTETGVANPEAITFPKDGLEITYSVGTFQANFLRVMLVLWIKIGFLAMLGIATATFLSFPVASLISFGTFLTAQSGQYLRQSLDNFSTTTNEGKTLVFNTIVAKVAQVVEWAVRTYADLSPTRRLVDGIELSWSSLAWGSAVLLVWTFLLFAIGSFALSRRELATYSGH